jgi:hypothetical protein
MISQFELPKSASNILSKALTPCMTNGDKLKLLMRSSEVREKISLHLRQNVNQRLFRVTWIPFRF